MLVKTRIADFNLLVRGRVVVGVHVTQTVVFPNPESLVGGELLHFENHTVIDRRTCIGYRQVGIAGTGRTGKSHNGVALGESIADKLRIGGVGENLGGINRFEVEIAHTRHRRQPHCQPYAAENHIFLYIHCVVLF